jgi:hypothetical protein
MNFKEAIEQIRTLLSDNVPAEQAPVALAEVPPATDMPAPEAAPAADAPADPVAAMEARLMALEEKINAIIAKIEEEAQPESVIEDMAVQNQNFKAAIEKLTDIVDQLSQTPVEEPSNFFQSFNLPKTKKDHLASIADNIASIKQSFKK